MQLPVVRFILLPSPCAPAMMVHAPLLNLERQKQTMNLLDDHKLHHRLSRIKLKDQDWREQPVPACFGAEGAAAEKINVIRKLMLETVISGD